MNNKENKFLAIRLVMMPKDANYMGSIFGGHIMSLIDLAAGEHAKSIKPHKYVTKIIREINFISPVFIGDAVSFYTETIKLGKSSITIKVNVEVQRGIERQEMLHVTTAEIVMVAVDKNNKPVNLFG